MTVERDESWHTARAQKLLWRCGAPIAGPEPTAFVVRLLDAVDRGVADEDAVEGALVDAADGSIGLAHAEPMIQTVPLDGSARTLGEAADVAVHGFAAILLASQREDPVLPAPPPTAAQRAELRERSRLRGAGTVDGAVEDLGSPDWADRANAAARLGRYRHAPAAPQLRRLRFDPCRQVREAALEALRRLDDGAGTT